MFSACDYYERWLQRIFDILFICESFFLSMSLAKLLRLTRGGRMEEELSFLDSLKTVVFMGRALCNFSCTSAPVFWAFDIQYYGLA